MGSLIRRVRQQLAAIPVWVWATVASLLLAPWYLRYVLGVLGQGCGFVLPTLALP